MTLKRELLNGSERFPVSFEAVCSNEIVPGDPRPMTSFRLPQINNPVR